MLKIVAGKVSFGALSYGSLEVIDCLCSVGTGDGRVVLVVPLGNHRGLILTKLGYTGLVQEGIFRASMASRGKETYLDDGVWTYSYRVY